MAIYSSAVFPPSQLWDYAVKLYNNPEVSAACLRLQDRRGLDVNMLLFSVWVAASGRGRLTDAEMIAGIEAGARWQADVVAPLRHVRRYLKGDIAPADNRLAAELGRGISDSELFAEHMELQFLNEILTRPATGSFGAAERGEAAADNLAAYLGHVTRDISRDDLSDLLQIWQQAFPGADPRLTGLFGPSLQ
ncbi:TIGR02444 family protein [Sneathiella sp. CAU 1612]|uniref:TIGR02444 family protein n=1 Tax=Sneathiella sedimenti TaxID=2816034 RepID=A0ABS3F507_9PROT|nr:TIGR02444 family protein [Sneathiella sedimenti]MBO0333590.1 TIGR02444 family protein [Sneathiella sedimenti]